MIQPELGKKISELRKTKGLTQDELVIMCNLSVRTLQRIESGEVTPRGYTVRAIFKALDYNISEFSQPEPIEAPTELNTETSWPGQIIRYVFDLFNLKTKTMKKLLILSSFTICMVFLFTSLTSAQTIDNKALVGKWQLCDGNGNPDTTGPSRVKIITSESFTVSMVRKESNEITIFFTGRFSLNNSEYTESITHAATPFAGFVGKTNKFKIELKGDRMYLKGIGNPYNEIWQRISK